MEDEQSGVLVHEFQKNERAMIRIHLQSLGGSEFVSLREWYRSTSESPWRPSRKGITVKPELFAELVKGVAMAAETVGCDVDFGESS